MLVLIFSFRTSIVVTFPTGGSPDTSSKLTMETENSGRTLIQCGSCDAASFSCWCLDCLEPLCHDCVSAHRRVSVTRSHRLLNQPPAGDVSTPPTKFCRLHPSEPLKLFCFTCNQLTCRDCQLMSHMSHRYEFVSEALDKLKKQLEEQVQPVRAQRDTVRRTLWDMETRLMDIVQHESRLKAELPQSYSVFLQHLQQRMNILIKEIENVHKSEREQIQRRMMKLKQLQQNQQEVDEAAEKAKNTKDLKTLLTYRAQIESQLKDLPDQDLSLPQKMSQMKVVTDSNSIQTLLNFGKLEVTWVPFQTSNKDQDNSRTSSSASPIILPPTTTSLDTSSLAPVNGLVPLLKSSSASCSSSVSYSTLSTSFSATPPTSASLPQSCRTFPQTGAPSICSSGAPVNFRSVSGQLCLPPSSSAIPVSLTSTCPSSHVTVNHLASSGKSLHGHSPPPPPSTVSTALLTVAPPISTSVALACKPLPQTRTTSDSVSLGTSWSYQVALPLSSPSCSTSSSLTPTCAAPLSSRLSLNVSSCQNFKQSKLPFVPANTVSVVPAVRPLSSWTVKTLSHLNTTLGQVQIKCIQPVSAFHLTLPPVKSGSVTSRGSSPQRVPLRLSTVFTPLPQSVVLHQAPPPHQNKPGAVLTVSLPSAVPQISIAPEQQKHCNLMTNIDLGKVPSASGSPQILRVVFAENGVSVGQGQDTAPYSLQPLIPDTSPDSSLLKQEQQSLVVKAVADSACDHSVRQVEARQREPAENEPTSTVCEETEPAGSACETSDSDSEEAKSVMRQREHSLSQWQPKVSLFRLPVSPARPGCPLPSFRLVHGDSEDEIYLEELSEDSQSSAAPVSNDCKDSSEPSSPESPVTLQLVSCSACGSANGSIICLSCGRAYHRDCHTPPVGPDIWSKWVCSLCQDLSDPSDPYSSERPQRPRGPCLSLLDQRRCESLLLHLKVEGCSRLPQSHLKLISERLTLRRSSPYATAAEFLSDVWSLLKQQPSSQDDALNKLQKSFHSRLLKTFGSDLHPSLSTPPSPGSDIIVESNLKQTRKRLRQFLGSSAVKRPKKDTEQE